jgi:hypothetical protein
MDFLLPAGMSRFISKKGNIYTPNAYFTTTITDPIDIVDAIAAGYSVSAAGSSGYGSSGYGSSGYGWAGYF